MGRFDNKSVLVTGAASGIGRATALEFAQEGASVMAFDINEEGLKETKDKGGDQIHIGICDVSTRDNCHKAVEDTVSELGGLDVLANVAGIAKAFAMTDIQQKDWDDFININLASVFWMSQAAIPHLLKTSGCIVNVASTAGLFGQAYMVPYCATKAGVIQITKAMALEYSKSEIRINAVAPGATESNITNNFTLPEDADFDLVGRYTGFRGIGTAEDISGAITYLAEAKRVHGIVLTVDGGNSAG